MTAKSTFSTRVGPSTNSKSHNKGTYILLSMSSESHSCVN